MKSIQFKWQYMAWFITILIGLILIETGFISLFTGYAPTKVSLLLWDNFELLIEYFTEEPLDTLLLVLIEKPLFQIESWQKDPVTVIWGLHFYTYTFIAHIFVAGLFSRSINLSRNSNNVWRNIPVTGCGLLIFSSLYLYLSSCCTAGANWIFHTALLAMFFNPVTATGSILEFYKLISGGFIWMQIVIALLGVYLIIKQTGVQRYITPTIRN